MIGKYGRLREVDALGGYEYSIPTYRPRLGSWRHNETMVHICSNLLFSIKRGYLSSLASSTPGSIFG